MEKLTRKLVAISAFPEANVIAATPVLVSGTVLEVRLRVRVALTR